MRDLKIFGRKIYAFNLILKEINDKLTEKVLAPSRVNNRKIFVFGMLQGLIFAACIKFVQFQFSYITLR